MKPSCSRFIIPVLVLLLSGSLVATSALSAASPGSAQDPLITESYLLQELEKERTAREALAERLETAERMLQSTGVYASSQLEERLSAVEARLQEGVGASGSSGSDGQFAERLSAVEQRLRELGTATDSTGNSAEEDDTSPLKLQVVSLRQGEAVYASAGAEIIMRSGELQVLSPATGGISDLTGAKDLQNGDSVPLNHLLLVPRDDQRGVEALSDSVFLLRGRIRYK